MATLYILHAISAIIADTVLIELICQSKGSFVILCTIGSILICIVCKSSANVKARVLKLE